MSIITQDGKDQGIAKKSSESSSASISRGRHCQIIRLLLIFIFLLVISTTLFLVGYSSTSSFETILNKNCPPSSSSSSNLFDQGSDQDVDSAESAGGALVLATLTSTIEITVTTTVTITPSPSPPSYIIHQSWKTTNLPSSFKKWSDSWLFHNPGFKRIVWDDEDNRNLIALHYPWFLSTYDSLPKHIEKVDAARIFYLHKFGGVYSDMDVECLASVAPLLE